MSFADPAQRRAVARVGYAEKHMVWGLIYLFAGGSALGQVLSETGTAKFVADRLSARGRRRTSCHRGLLAADNA